MNITVFGASGNVGSLVVEKLLKDGHNLTVFVHKSSPFAASEQLKIVAGDIHDASQVQLAVADAEVVISTLGSWHTPTKDILSAAMRGIFPAVSPNTRVITLTGADAQAPGEKVGMIQKALHAVFSLVAKDVMADSETHLQLLHDSGLKWTSVRSPVMRNGPATNYKLNTKPTMPWSTVTRHTVAQAIVDQVTATDQLQAAPRLHAA